MFLIFVNIRNKNTLSKLANNQSLLNTADRQKFQFGYQRYFYKLLNSEIKFMKSSINIFMPKNYFYQLQNLNKLKLDK